VLIGSAVGPASGADGPGGLRASSKTNSRGR